MILSWPTSCFPALMIVIIFIYFLQFSRSVYLICIMFYLIQVDAIEYYSNLEETLTRQVMDEKRIALQSNLGMAFVTVQSEAMGAK